MEGARGFGFVFRFLTFWGIVLNFAYNASAASGLAGAALALKPVTFSIELTVITLYWIIYLQSTDNFYREGQKRTPAFIDKHTHLGAPVRIALDVLLAPEAAFEQPRALYRVIFVVILYIAWTLLCRWVLGFFTYPFLNVLEKNMLHLVTFIVGACLWVYACFQVGAYTEALGTALFGAVA